MALTLPAFRKLLLALIFLSLSHPSWSQTPTPIPTRFYLTDTQVPSMGRDLSQVLPSGADAVVQSPTGQNLMFSWVTDPLYVSGLQDGPWNFRFHVQSSLPSAVLIVAVYEYDGTSAIGPFYVTNLIDVPSGASTQLVQVAENPGPFPFTNGNRLYFEVYMQDNGLNPLNLAFNSAAFDSSIDVPLGSSAPTPTSTLTFTPTATFTRTLTPTSTATRTATRTNTQTATPTSTSTLTSSPTATSTSTSTATKTSTPTATDTFTRTSTPTATSTSTSTDTKTSTPTATETFTRTSTATDTPVPPTATSTFTAVPPTASATKTASPTSTSIPPTATSTSTAVPPTASATKTPSPTSTPIPPTATSTFTPLAATPTWTLAPSSPTATSTPGVEVDPDTPECRLDKSKFDGLKDPPLKIEYRIKKGGHVKVHLKDGHGKKVRELVDSETFPGTYTVDLDGKDDHGIPVYSGIYVIDVEENGRHDRKKVLILHR